MSTSPPIQPFAHLYNHLKTKDPKLFEAMTKIVGNMVMLSPTLSLQFLGNNASLNIAYNGQLKAIGGIQPFTYSISGNPNALMPLPGIILNSATGQFSGVPTSTGTFTFTGNVTDAQGNKATVSCTLIVGLGNNLIEGSFASRPAGLGVSNIGYIYRSVGTSSGITYAITERWNGTSWEYLYGSSSGPYTALSTLAGILTASEVGWIFNETTYQHSHAWNGSVWTWGPGDSGSGGVVGPQANPPNQGVWGACDGSPVAVSQPDGGALVNEPTQQLNSAGGSGNVVLASGGFSTTIVAATASTGLTSLAAAGSVVNAITAINAPDTTNGGMPPLYTGSWWMRI